MREYTVQYFNAKGEVELYSFEALNIEEAVSIAQNDVDEYPNIEIYDDTDAEDSNRGVLLFKNGEQKTVHRIEDVMLTKHNNGSDNLQYTADGREPTAIELATAIRELADWLRESHYDKIF